MTTTDQALEEFIQSRVDAMYAAYARANKAFADAIAEIETIQDNLDRAMEGRNHERIGEVRGLDAQAVFDAFGAIETLRTITELRRQLAEKETTR